MRSDTITVTAADGTELHVYRWLPDAGPERAVVLIAHGMAEHAARYERFAQALTGAGYAVFANDHRGHGQTGSRDDHGYFADDDGVEVVLNDMAAVARAAKADRPDLPLVLFGHSMGSFLARLYAARPTSSRDRQGRTAEPIDALILSGTAGDPGPIAVVGKGLAAVEAKLRGGRTSSKLMDTIAFARHNDTFKPARTKFDWLSRDPIEVDAYVNDPLCGNVFSSGFYQDLLEMVRNANRPATAAAVAKDLPILFISGNEDPVGDFGKGVTSSADAYRTAGSTDVTVTLYPGGRHEMLNETNRAEVTADILAWLDERLPAVTS